MLDLYDTYQGSPIPTQLRKANETWSMLESQQNWIVLD